MNKNTQLNEGLNTFTFQNALISKLGSLVIYLSNQIEDLNRSFIVGNSQARAACLGFLEKCELSQFVPKGEAKLTDSKLYSKIAELINSNTVKVERELNCKVKWNDSGEGWLTPYPKGGNGGKRTR